MFTGIIEESGVVRAISRGANSICLTIGCTKILEDASIGDSIAVNGVCLTAATIGSNVFSADVMPETMRRTNLSFLRTGSPVNLERALTLGGRLGGHLVSGHIDGTGTVISRTADDNAIWLGIAAEPAILRYIVLKGSIALDGVSLTVARIDNHHLEISLIPHTAGQTTLGSLKPGHTVNIECDLIGKYVEKLLRNYPPAEDDTPPGMTMEWLTEHL